MASTVDLGVLWKFFHNSGVKQSSSHWKVHCKACVAYHERALDNEATAANGGLTIALDAGTELLAKKARFELGA